MKYEYNGCAVRRVRNRQIPPVRLLLTFSSIHFTWCLNIQCVEHSQLLAQCFSVTTLCLAWHWACYRVTDRARWERHSYSHFPSPTMSHGHPPFQHYFMLRRFCDLLPYNFLKNVSPYILLHSTNVYIPFP